MNKRHYEHTLPNIRGSLSNTYDATAGKDMQAVFTIDGKQLQFTFPAGTKWERSYRNIYDIVLGNNGLVIGGADGSGVTIEPWTDDVKGEIQLVPVI